MAHIVFYEKPGCINNIRQKKLLVNAGHQLECKNLLKTKWDRQSLVKYFGEIPVPLCFNSSAPEIKSGMIRPFLLSADEALELMIQNPILIRRPLMRVGDEYRIGFEVELVDKWVGLLEKDLLKLSGKVDLQTCTQQTDHVCKTPDR